MKRLILIAAGIFLLAPWAASAGQSKHASARAHSPKREAGTTTQPAIRHLIVISVDGLMPATYTNPDAHALKVPTLRELARNGAASPGVRGVMPAVTYAAHTTMVTGVNPGTHGIVSNAVFDPMGKADGAWYWYTEDIRVPTLWDVAREHGLRTALVGWPVTMGARVDFLVPEFWRGMGNDEPKLLRAISTPGLLAAAEKEFPGFAEGLSSTPLKDRSLTDVAVHLIQTAKPNLLMLHIAEVDHWQHERGPWSAEALAAIENADAQLARILAAVKSAGIWDRSAFVIVSDHGFWKQAKLVRPGVLLRQKGLITLDEKTQRRVVDWKAQVLANAGSAYIYVRNPDDAETRRVVTEMFQSLKGKPDSGIGRVFDAQQIAAMGGDPAAFLALEPAEGFGFGGGAYGDYFADIPHPGIHGFPPDRDEMLSSLILYGPTISAGKIEHARMIDIGPTLARLLGLGLEKAEGKPLALPMKQSPH